jgi:pyruvate formate lyase activating enzyme
VPTFNDTAEEIKAIAKFAASLPSVEQLHLLPYHRLGQDKYAGLGRNYALKEIQPPSQEKMEYLLSVAEEVGLKCQIGG